MTSSEIRDSFLGFFREKLHTVVPSASLLPQSPGLLFTNAGMNPFVPYFLGTDKAPYSPPRATDTQKCIRAGGKHNDLDDVGYDTYHHTFFEMLGNWSFGDYFKTEAISWAWELVVERWGFPANRLYATVYAPKPGDPGEFDQEAYDQWAGLFQSKGLDPSIHIVNGNVKDNFWMMGETGPCGPCSELHVDLTPNGDTKGSLVNQSSDLCIEIWNLVFIQYNAEADGSFRDLPSKHVDTGMGFERACSIIQGTKGLADFSKKPTNYATDVFRPIFDKLEELSVKTYEDIYPEPGAERSLFSEELKSAIAFRVIADHLRTLSFSIADGILPGNNGRNYVLRSIFRRAISYGRQLGFSGEKSFFGSLVGTLVEEMREVFPELKRRQEVIIQTLENEEASFNRTLDNGTELAENYCGAVNRGISLLKEDYSETSLVDLIPRLEKIFFNDIWMRMALSRCVSNHTQKLGHTTETLNDSPAILAEVVGLILKEETQKGIIEKLIEKLRIMPAELAFKLTDEKGFPLGLVELMAKQNGMSVDLDGHHELLEQQQERSRAAQKTTVVRALGVSTNAVTEFVGFDCYEVEANVVQILQDGDNLFVITDRTPFYAEMGGQAGDTGTLIFSGIPLSITGVQQIGKARGLILPVTEMLKLEYGVTPITSPFSILTSPLTVGAKVVLRIDAQRRRPIEAHHTATHLLHWALHEVVSRDATQQGSSVDENRLRFDFNSAPVTPEQLAAMEEKVNSAIAAKDPVSWKEVPHAEVKGRADVMQFFGDKYGDLVRVVQVGGQPGALNGYSQELCGGAHVRNTGEIGLFKIKSEGAIASGVRRIEAVCGEAAWAYLNEVVEKWDAELKAATAKLKSANDKLAALGEPPVTVNGFPHIMDDMLASRADISQLNATFSHGQRALDETKEASVEAEKRLKKLQASSAAKMADGALAELIAKGEPIISSFEADASLLQELLNGLKKKGFAEGAFLVVDDGEKLHIGTYCGDAAQARGLKAGDLLRELAALAGGKGGGKPDQARGAAPERDKLASLEAAARTKLA
jgi:alanyl-tRNA synthetase